MRRACALSAVVHLGCHHHDVFRRFALERGRSGCKAKAIDEDVDQPQHARLPAGLVVHVAHADQRPQQVLGADVGADLAGGDRAIEQCADGPVRRSNE